MDENQDKDLNFFYKEMRNLSVREDGILRQVGTENSETGQIVIPRSLTSRVLQMMHDDLGHFGTAKTSARVRERFFWSSMSLEVDDLCRNCFPCQKRKNPVPTKRAPLQPIVTHRPGELVTMDIVEYPLSSRFHPSFLEVGRELRLRSDLHQPHYGIPQREQHSDYATKLKTRLNQAFKTARDTLKMTHYTQKAYYDR